MGMRAQIGAQPRSAKSTTQQAGERQSSDSVWKVKCLEEVGDERLSPQRRVEPQCESHSLQLQLSSCWPRVLRRRKSPMITARQTSSTSKHMPGRAAIVWQTNS